VKKIVPTADRAKATVMTKVSFDQLDNRVLPEMSAKVSFLPLNTDTTGLDTRSVISVPQGALVESDGTMVAFIIRQGRVTRTPVTIGDSYGGSYEVRSGLDVGDVVVLHPAKGLGDGDRVELKK
jgi:multidrug efflux pump subunit AcrA (membrane-fusion protein)